MATLQARRLLPTNGGRPDTDLAFLYIYPYPVSSFWLFEQCSKFTPHPYVHSVRPEFGDHDIARSISPNSLYSDSIPIVTGSPLTHLKGSFIYIYVYIYIYIFTRDMHELPRYRDNPLQY